ncbi:hypothetical protein [Vreelandella titanicae]|uniref:hypothetical protein n=1 Tax=Vreelandella titanicae TaxID=664683 RepID=UPI001593C68D|nr:hypothetical protein [Halomonas titanicae]NVE91541.1 hypothetical protein [Halomonas titanicae]
MFTVNVNRSYQYPVSLTIYDDEGKEITGKFTALFKVVPQDQLNALPEGTLLLDQVLTGVKGLGLTGEDGKTLEGDELLHAAKNDPAISTALLGAFNTSISKKNRPRI